jgi:exodeoxyribonuclease VII large subunit
VRVTGPDGRTITDRAAAAQEASLTLKFRDGELEVGTGGDTPPPAPRRKPRKSGTPPKQDDLFG